MHRPCRVLAVLLTLAVAAGCSDDTTSVTVHEADLHDSGDGMTYHLSLVLGNRTGDDRTLELVGAADFESTSFHDATALTVAAGSRVTLAPPAAHVLLHRPRRMVHAGDRSLVTLHFANGQTLHVDAVVH